MSTPNEVQPLPCPFCGEPPKAYTLPAGGGMCACENRRCHAKPEVTSFGWSKGDVRGEDDKTRAIKKWNRRATPPAPEGWAEAVEDKAEWIKKWVAENPALADSLRSLIVKDAP